MTITISPEKLAEFDALTLKHGAHKDINQGACAMEVVSWLADEGFTDAPSCASPVLRRYIIRLNDRWDDEKRQTLKPYLLRTIGTGGDGKDARREEIAMEWATRRLLGPWLRLAGLTSEADALEAGDLSNRPEMYRLIRAARDSAWSLRNENHSKLRALVKTKVIEELAKKKPAAAAADADAAAAAAAAAVADAAADAAAVAVAAADAAAVAAAAAAAVADAAAAAVADADAAAVAAADAAAAAAAAAAAVADAAAAAVADAAAVAAADAAAVADADAAAAAAAAAAADAAAVAAADGYSDPWGKSYSAAYTAARKYYDEHPLPISQQVADIAAEQEGAALQLLDLLIEAA